MERIPEFDGLPMQRPPFMNAPNDPAVQYVRTLSAMERGFFSHGQYAPILFSMTLQFAARLDSDRLMSAFCSLQATHQALRVQIVDNPEMGLAFIDAERPLDVTFVDATDPQGWMNVVQADLNRWDERKEDGLFKATVLRSPAMSSIVFTFNHAIADGRSAFQMLSDFVRILDGQPVARRELVVDPRAYLEQRRTDGEPSPASVPDFVRPAEVKTSRSDPLILDSLELDGTMTDRVSRMARAYGVTIQGVLSACAVRATRDARVGPLRLSSPIDARALLRAPGDSSGVFLAMALDTLDEPEGEAFWQLAARASRNIARQRDNRGIAQAFEGLEAVVPKHADAAAALAILPPMVMDVMISNLGAVDLPETSSRTPVVAVWGPMLNTQVAANDVVGAITYNGHLRLTHAGSGARPDLLRVMCGVLEKALKTPFD